MCIVGERYQIGYIAQRFCRNTNIRLAIQQHGDNFIWAGLVEYEMYLGKYFFKPNNYAWESILGLSVGCGNDEFAIIKLTEFFG